MFFVNHSANENAVQEIQSQLNMHEAEFIVALYQYIILQGYDKSQVTILTTYSAQLKEIKKSMKDYHLLDDAKATTVDNYQGEECDIILLSFVRSNEEGDIGFLKDSNRVNVALSRAKKGLYCIGNFDCMSRRNKLWQSLVVDLKTQQAIGTALKIVCQNHPEHQNLVSSASDFSVAPDGGCAKKCGYRMPCGHVCERSCIDLPLI